MIEMTPKQEKTEKDMWLLSGKNCATSTERCLLALGADGYAEVLKVVLHIKELGTIYL